ncbi:hypothetical protein, partial [Bacillus rhizoplanae]|uniref:hypothetical protein n=1 Tax=Bacillus rhizoplanae TaxID=2880966 RepID=UPI003D195E76
KDASAGVMYFSISFMRVLLCLLFSFYVTINEEGNGQIPFLLDHLCHCPLSAVKQMKGFYFACLF